ncbi:transcriptional regulator [Halobacteroides halobius DSM 5150]|uniref:Transcriptional regulator n=1 Tax=Halobacteroides halobius (strain ATCC 35273 / DSM 5150 / MD-1) TaxID=748449 RepID=L0K9W9_HALHC|nr:MarR family transcriptional regulator [Halobacteroides halobius]AGB41310.1 transcriptional regulator [Halobacteroides halobius DSM 5150]
MIDEPIGKYLSMTYRAHVSLLNKKLKPYDISHGQILLLIALYNQEGICQHQICQMYNLNKAAVGRGIKKLEEIGFITKQTDPNDKRKNLIYLTNKAKNFETKFREILCTVENEVRRDLSKKEIKTFLKVINKINHNLTTKLNN